MARHCVPVGSGCACDRFHGCCGAGLVGRVVLSSALEMVQSIAASTASPPRLWLMTRGARSTTATEKSVEVVQAML